MTHPDDAAGPVPVPVTVATDRALRVPAGHTVRTAWVHVDALVLGCRDRMDFAAVERAGRTLQYLGADGLYPPPNGVWRADGRFEVRNGRHEAMAALILGRTHILVAWIAPPEEP